MKAGIFILSQDTIERKIYLKTCLYFLFRNFNSKYKYPVIILCEDNYSEKSKQEILKSIRADCSKLVSFRTIDKEDFEVPNFININKVNKSIESKPVPYWRNLKYRLMCRFWLIHFWKYTNDYDYIIRIDDDGFIEEPINNDLFDIMNKNKLVYISNIIHIDCGLCCYKMRELLEHFLPDKKDTIKQIFTEAKLPLDNEHFLKFKNTYEIIEEENFTKNEFTVNMPLMYYNNFMVTSVDFWKQKDVVDLIDKIDRSGLIFYYRLGDAPIQTAIIMLLSTPDKISRAIFKYSKRLQREVYTDDNGDFHAYFPNNYDHTSCITYK